MKKHKMSDPIWCKGRVPNGFWKKQENRCRYMKWLGKELDFKKPEGWYRITANDFKSNSGHTILNYYGDSPSAAVMQYIPDYDWKEWLFDFVPNNFWKIKKNRPRYMEWLGEKLGYKKTEDWYKIKQEDYESNKGDGLLVHYYRGSPSAAVKEYIPNYDWKEWLFVGGVPNDFWNKLENRHRYMEWLGKELGYKKTEDWYKIKQEDYESNNWGGLLVHYYRGSPSAAVKEYIPNYDWKEWLFVGGVPNDFWNKPENRHRYTEWLGKELGYKKTEDWYRITANDFKNNEGQGFMMNYNQNSPSLAVKEFIPDYDWKEWLLDNVPLGFWKIKKNRRRYMEWLGKKLGYKKPEDWYKVTKKDFESNRGHTILDYYGGSPSATVMEYIPNYDWQPEKFSYLFKTQKKLYRITKEIFPNRKVKWNFKHPDLRFEDTGRYMELDIFVPSLDFAIEYQGEQNMFCRYGEVPRHLRKFKRGIKRREKPVKSMVLSLLKFLILGMGAKIKQ